MAGNDENDDRESWAAWIVAAVLGGTPKRRDVPTAPPATHDFDVLLPGKVLALEVTSAAVAEVREMEVAIERRRWEAPNIEQDWALQVDAAGRGHRGANIADIHRKAAALLAVLERRAVYGIDLGAAKGVVPDDARDAVRRLRALGVVTASASGPPPPGRPAMISVGTVGTGRVIDGSAVNAAVERTANENASKLASAATDGRHLFVWMDPSDPASEGALFLGLLPTLSPALPAGLEEVWVATWAPRVVYHCYASTLWRITDGSEWEALAPPDVLNHVERVTGDSSARQAEDAALDDVRSKLLTYGVHLRRRLRLPNV
ncbi:MAG: hypothetical protein ACYDAQ_09510 [Mycobacteriales bacterium]